MLSDMSAFRFDMTVTPSTDAMVRQVGDESVVLDLKSGRYLSIDPVGSVIWSVLASGGTPESAVSAVLEEFEVTEDVVRQDMQSFVTELVRLELVSA
jgi:hypothetical protein